jgi:hypothetical protein
LLAAWGQVLNSLKPSDQVLLHEHEVESALTAFLGALSAKHN